MSVEMFDYMDEILNLQSASKYVRQLVFHFTGEFSLNHNFPCDTFFLIGTHSIDLHLSNQVVHFRGFHVQISIENLQHVGGS
jgi:hypothetical protein